MSSFYCDKCGALCSDTPQGYVSGCEHYPADIEECPRCGKPLDKHGRCPECGCMEC